MDTKNTQNNVNVILNQFYLPEESKKDIKFLTEYKNTKHPKELLSRIFVFTGEPGVGKTFLTEKIIRQMQLPTIYIANETFQFKNSKKCNSMQDLIKHIDNKEQLIFIDDLNYFLEKKEFEISVEDKRHLLNVLNVVKNQHNKILIITANQLHELDESIISRMEIKILFGAPTIESKTTYLEKHFSKYLKDNQIKYIAENSIGLNYRELPELIKLIYRISEGKINIQHIKKALETYKPASLHNYEVINIKDHNLNSIIGKEQVVNTLRKVIQTHKNPELSRKLCIHRSNLLLFHGSHGTGKTFAAKSFAAEIGYPIILIKGENIMGGSPFSNVSNIIEIARRHSRCVILIDEADKIFGNARFGEDSIIIGELNRAIESIEKDNIKAILILTINDMTRFGESFQDRFVTIEFNNPTQHERETYCRNKIQSITHNLNPTDIERLARVTNNMSFREIDRLWNKLMYAYLDNNKVLDTETINKALRDIKKDETTTMFG